MDVVEILLLGVVGLSVLVFLILDNLDPHRPSKKGTDSYDSDSKCRIDESEAKESGYDQSVGGEGDDENRPASEVNERECFQESEEREETDDLEFIDDWEGVERSELDKVFGEAMVFASDGDGIGEDVKLQLYGFQKVALEGPSHGSHPMTLHLSPLSKWRAWQKVGDISRETAMEKYIDVLSEAIPDWNGNRNRNLQSRVGDALTIKDTKTYEDVGPTPHEAER